MKKSLLSLVLALATIGLYADMTNANWKVKVIGGVTYMVDPTTGATISTGFPVTCSNCSATGSGALFVSNTASVPLYVSTVGAVALVYPNGAQAVSITGWTAPQYIGATITAYPAACVVNVLYK